MYYITVKVNILGLRMSKKILYLSPQDVIPPIDGGKIGIYYPIKELAKKNKLYFGYIKNNKNNTEKKYRKININPVGFYKNTKDNIFLVLKNFFSEVPFKMDKYFDKRFFNILKHLINNENIDVVICSHSHMAMYGLKLKEIFPKVKIILREHNIEYELIKEYYLYEKNILKKIVAYWQYKKTKKYEIDLWKKFDYVVFISDNDIKEASTNIKLDRKHIVIYDGFDNQIIPKNLKKEKNSFIFTGNLNTVQNNINLNKFIKEIWIPLIKNNKDYKLYITGNKEELLLKKLNFSRNQLKQLNIINLGFVENINKTIITKEYFISPTYIGSGIRMKVLHALALGMITFISEKDYNMIKYFRDLENVVLFKNSQEFLNKLKVLENDNLKENIMKNAKNLISEKLNWNNYIKGMEKIL